MVKKKSSKKNSDVDIKIKNVDKMLNSCDKNHCGISCNNSSAIYGLGFIGSVIYYVSTAASFWVGVLGILKSLVWPAFLVFELLKFLGA